MKPNSTNDRKHVAPQNASLSLFGDDATAPSLERALAIVARFPLDAVFIQERTKCPRACCHGGASHGPYWYARIPIRDGESRGHRLYVGSDAKRRAIETAHTMVREALQAAELAAKRELERAERSPELTQLRSLQAAAFARIAHSARENVVPLKKTSASPKTKALPRGARQGS